jgi:hypothetical protein
MDAAVIGAILTPVLGFSIGVIKLLSIESREKQWLGTKIFSDYSSPFGAILLHP